MAIHEVIGKPYTFYLTEFARQTDAFLDVKENILDPARRFMSGPQKGLYDEARKFIQNQEPNFPYIVGDEPGQLEIILDEPNCFKNNRMQQAKSLVDALKAKIGAQLEIEKYGAKVSVTSLKERLIAMPEFACLNAEQQSQFYPLFDTFLHGLDRQMIIAVISDTRRRFEEDEYQRILGRLNALTEQNSRNTEDTGVISNHPTVVADSPVEYVAYRSIRADFDKTWLADEADVDYYLALVRKALLKEIHDGKRIQI